MNTILLLLHLLCILKVEGYSHSHFSTPIYKTALSKATVKIVEKFYSLHQTHLNILSASSGDRFRTMYLANEIMYHFRGMIKLMYFNGVVLWRIGSSTNNLIIIDGYEGFQEIYRKLKSDSVDYTGYFLIVVSSNLGEHFESILQQIFEACFNRYIVNVNVLIGRFDSNSDIIDMYTYFPFTEDNCRSSKPILYDSFEKGTFSTKSTIFPSKTSNFYGCPISVVTWHYPPHMILEKYEHGERINYQGIDGNILHILVEKMNFSLKFDLTVGYRGNVYWNGSATGALGVILNGRGNITICSHGFMFTVSYRTSTSANYLSVGLLFAMPTLRSYSSFEKLFLIFSWAVWSSILAMYLIAICVILFLKTFSRRTFFFVVGEGNNSPCLNIYRIATGAPILKLPKRSFARYLFMLWTVATIILRSSYQGSLFDYLQKTEEREKSPSLVHFLSQGYTLFVPLDFLQWFDPFAEIKPHLKVMNQSLWLYFDAIQNPDYKGIVLTTDIQIDYYNHQHRKGSPIRSLKERLFYTPQSIFYPKHSFLLKPIDLILEECLSGGLIMHWVKTFLEERPSSSKTIHKPISYSDLQGFFSATIGLYTIAIIVFLFEMLSSRIKFMANFFEFLMIKLQIWREVFCTD